MDRLIVRCLPEPIRARHEAEIHDMLATTDAPIRDRADIVLAATGLRLGSRLRSVLIATSAVGLVLVIALVGVVRELRGGVADVPNHWWSALTAAGSAGVTMMVVCLTVARWRAEAWRSDV